MTWEDEEADVNDYEPMFVGPCTCNHEPDEHGWLACNVAHCVCDARWEE